MEDWRVLPSVIGDSGDVDRGSLGESAFSLSKRDVLPLKEVANQGVASALGYRLRPCPFDRSS
jgi:hypothetical protein